MLRYVMLCFNFSFSFSSSSSFSMFILSFNNLVYSLFYGLNVYADS